MFDIEYYPSEITTALCKLAVEARTALCKVDTEISEDEKTDCTDAIYDLMAKCQNENNSDYFRTFYGILEDIFDYAETLI